MMTAVREQVNRMEAGAHFKLLAALMKDNPAAASDAPMDGKMAQIGIVPRLRRSWPTSRARAPRSKESNWLPAPAGRFILMLRFYGPKEAIIDGTWKPPEVVR
jgi:hypothetical protein